MNIYKVKWSPLVSVTTVGVALVFLYIDISLINGLIYSASAALRTLIVGIVNVIVLSVILNIPLYIKLNNDSIEVKKIVGKIQIKFSDIVFVKSFNPSADIRIFGSGGFGGFIGKFSNNDYGWYTSYVLNTKQNIQ
jgi:hypothetical protein